MKEVWRIGETVEGGEFQSRGKKNGEDCEGRTNRMMDSSVDLKKKGTTYTCSIYIHKIAYKRENPKPKKE